MALTKKIFGFTAGALSIIAVQAQQTCLYAEAMGFVGRDGGGGSWCDSQLSTCNTVCNNAAQFNTCTGPSGAVTNGGDFCYECVCSDGSAPDLDIYGGSIPALVCGRAQENCDYGYDQVGQLPPPGTCTECPYETADVYTTALTSITTTPLSSTTTSVAVTVSTIAPIPITTSTTSSTSTSSTSVSTSTPSVTTPIPAPAPTSSNSSVSSSSSSSLWSSPSSSFSSSLAPANTSIPTSTLSASPTFATSSSATVATYTGAALLIEPLSSISLFGALCGLAGYYLV